MISQNTLLKLSVQYLKHISLSSKGTDTLISCFFPLFWFKWFCVIVGVKDEQAYLQEDKHVY